MAEHLIIKDSLIFISLLLDHTRTIDEFRLRGISVHITICSAMMSFYLIKSLYANEFYALQGYCFF